MVRALKPSQEMTYGPYKFIKDNDEEGCWYEDEGCWHEDEEGTGDKSGEGGPKGRVNKA